MKKRYWPLISKALLLAFAILAYAYIIHKLVYFDYWPALFRSISLTTQAIGLAAILLSLWFINLFCEAKKWQALMHPFYRIKFINAWQQVMAGTTTALGSPARLAEMGGRMALLPKKYRANAAIMTILGGFIQNLIIITFGVFALLLIPDSIIDINISGYYYWLATGLIALAILSTYGIIYFYADKIRYYLKVIKNTSRSTLIKSTLWTTLRYSVYHLQLFFWLYFFGVQISTSDFILLAMLYFLMISVIPSHILIDMGIRGSVALFLFSSASNHTPNILMATFCMWMSNVILPTLIGSYTLIRQKLLKQRVMQKET
ncbi:lysylphosphatidylglycerol synthase transmembrane domain-containing protein [Carboxylicivirga marina]|uniref:Flippase-like domain-containing protein n=1 Tax=Carboxylicivirga marina TaxID=2800988 RepID=A0ABS1HG56_9BACT|nr:hypothetical protein [Carboxylicivirga marina]MBK3516647.1 hypothetical protein [Carboxylicivirga marina]